MRRAGAARARGDGDSVAERPQRRPFKYFPAGAPPRIFVRCDRLPAGVNPVWDNRPGGGMRFVGPEDGGR